jgi:hypothetical protein
MSKYVCAALTENIRANYWHSNRQTASKGANLTYVMNKRDGKGRQERGQEMKEV